MRLLRNSRDDVGFTDERRNQDMNQQPTGDNREDTVKVGVVERCNVGMITRK